jgi:hypothetical protein
VVADCAGSDRLAEHKNASDDRAEVGCDGRDRDHLDSDTICWLRVDA